MQKSSLKINIKASIFNWVLIFCLILIEGCSDNKSTNNLTEEDISQLNHAAGLMGQYNYSEAFETLDALHKKHPQNSRIKLDLAVATLNRQQHGDIQKALNLATQVNQQQAQNARAKYLLGILYLYQGNSKEAALHLKLVLTLQQEDAYVHYFYAQAIEQLGQTKEAFKHYKRAAELLPYLRSAIYAAAMAARKTGNKNEAKQYLNRYRKLKNNPRGLLAEFKYTRMGRLAELATSKEQLTQPTPFVPKSAVWEIVKEIEIPQSNYFSLVQNINPKIKSRIISFNNLKDIPRVSEKTSNISLENFPLSDVKSTALGDINNDGLTDLVVCSSGRWKLYLQLAATGWNEVSVFPQQSPQSCGDVKLFDADHDGDVDIFIANFSGADELFSNNGDLSFRRLSENWTLKNQANTIQILPVDWDHDRDLDIILLKDNGKLLLLKNQLLWNYEIETINLESSNSKIEKILVLDNNSDGNWELLTSEKTTLRLWNKTKPMQWKSKIITETIFTNDNFLVEDFDGDGLLELVSYGTKGMVWYNLTNLNQTKVIFNKPVTSLKVMAQNNSKGPGLLALTTSKTGSRIIIFSETANQSTFVKLQLQGGNNDSKAMRTNRQAIGAEIRGRVGQRWVIPTAFTANSSFGQDFVPKMVSTLGTDKLDYVEIRWPDGVYQTELNLSKGNSVITEKQRQLSSCPVLFVETEKGYQFVSDILGVGGVGFLAQPGEYVESRPWEYFLLPSNLIPPGSKKVSIKITEPMEENTYLDSVKLHRYKLPEEWQMVVDERMGVNPPLPSGEALFYKNSYLADSAVNANGDDISHFLEEVDNNPVPIEELHHQHIGLVEKPQQLSLSFAVLEKNSSDKKYGLIIDGWVEYPYSQTVFAAWQSGQTYNSPTIEIKVNNQWEVLHHQLGYPAGMPRTSFFPLNGMPKSVTGIRITTNLELYFDSIKLVEIETPPAMEHDVAVLTSATMEYIGFPQRSNAASNRPVYNYKKRTPYSDMKTLTGDFTRFGEISELVAVEDNAFAIIGSGESVAIEFNFKNNHSTLNNEFYVLEARGYAKDMDLYTNTGGTVSPLPVTQLDNLNTKTAEKLHHKYNTRYQDGW